LRYQSLLYNVTSSIQTGSLVTARLIVSLYTITTKQTHFRRRPIPKQLVPRFDKDVTLGMDIQLSHILPLAHPEEFKLHLASWNGSDQPLDVFVRSRVSWDGWNRWRGKRNDFNRKFIFSLIDFYPEKDTWLFGGAYRVASRKKVTNGLGYEIESLKESEPFIGRLKISLKRPSRIRALYLEKHYENLIVKEILGTPYAGEAFRRYEEIDIGFAMLENIIAVQKPDWKGALGSVKGIYLITDTNNGKRYVGSAYGSNGVWSRWADYVSSGHGNNAELVQVIKPGGIEYARKYFRFALLETR